MMAASYSGISDCRCIVDSICRLNLCWNWFGILLRMQAKDMFSNIASTHLIQLSFLHGHPQKQKNSRKSTPLSISTILFGQSQNRPRLAAKQLCQLYGTSPIIPTGVPSTRFPAAISSTSRSAHRFHRAVGREQLQAAGPGRKMKSLGKTFMTTPW